MYWGVDDCVDCVDVFNFWSNMAYATTHAGDNYGVWESERCRNFIMKNFHLIFLFRRKCDQNFNGIGGFGKPNPLRCSVDGDE